ncbi:hypothetical protein HID58_064618 [Brassica napus]|uniref:Uncharacterized protein n=1 Tax=Brassica napus TaxID=3708 RepID=A0ABQ7ZAQ4_BRANA|nr:hypothetical protein HID58_064618 [Brassica napus]
MLISCGFFFILPRFSKIFLTEGIHSVSEASRSINGREFICLYGKDSAEIVIKQPKRSHMFLKMIVLVFAMVCGLYICSVCLKQFSVQTSQLFRTRITTRIHYPKPETFNRWKLKQQPETSALSGVSIVICQNYSRETLEQTNRGGESIGFNTKPLIKPLQVGKRIAKITPSRRTKRSDEFRFLAVVTELIIIELETLLISQPMNTLKNETENAEV